MPGGNHCLEGKLIPSSFCLLSCIELLADSHQRKSDGIYASCPTFCIKSHNDGEIPELRLPFVNSPLNICKNYHSFELYEITIQNTYSKEEIKNIMTQHLPCITYVDSYICSWTDFSRQRHLSHFIIISNFDEDGNMICLDPFLSETEQNLNFDDYYQYCIKESNNMNLYDFKKMYGFRTNNNKDKDIIIEVVNTAKYVLENHMMEELEEYSLILQNESIYMNDKSYDCLCDDGVLDLKSVFYTRKDFLRALTYSFTFNHNTKLEDIIKDYEVLIEYWKSLNYNVFSLLKIENIDRKKKLLNKVCEKLIKICDLEKELMQRIAMLLS